MISSLRRGNRIVIPVSLRPEILEKLHSAHQGVARIKPSIDQPCLKLSKVLQRQNSTS